MAGSVLGGRAQDKGQRIQQARAMFGEVGNRLLMKMTLDNWPLGEKLPVTVKRILKVFTDEEVLYL